MSVQKHLESLFSPEELAEIESALSYKFNDPEFLLNALTRRSFWHENRSTCADHNERMEFLGDSVLNLVIAHVLYTAFPEAPEGQLQKKRASLVRQNALAKVMRQIGLAKYIRMGKGDEISGCRDRNSILADTIEAIIAAVFLDGGYHCAEQIINTHFRSMLQNLKDYRNFEDPKSLLQEKSQAALGMTPFYILLDESGEEHARTFKMGVVIGETLVAEGQGPNKKEAAQVAASHALSDLQWPT